MPPDEEPDLQRELVHFAPFSLDLILVEGFKNETFPKIELHRASLNKPLLYSDDASIIAIASDTVPDLPEPKVLLDINNPVMIADFILNRFIRKYN